jgi:hypothetical protein
MTIAVSAPRIPVADPCQGFVTELVLSCGRGDEAALGDLFDLTFFFVAAAVSRDHDSSAGIDDEVVEAYERIWRRSVTYRPEDAAVLDWLFDQARDCEGSMLGQGRMVTA